MLSTIQLGAKVQNEKGDNLGAVKFLVADPYINEVTHLVVEKSVLFNVTQKVVPANSVENVSNDGQKVQLNLSKERFEKLDDFREREYVENGTTGTNLKPGATFSGTGYLYPLVGNPIVPTVAPIAVAPTTESAYTVKTNVPDNSLIIKNGADVQAKDGRIGTVKKVELDPASHQITGFLIEEGGFFDEEYFVPMELVESISENAINLKLEKTALQQATLNSPVEPPARFDENAL